MMNTVNNRLLFKAIMTEIWNPNTPVTLENCKDEPIHIPGAVQPFGILLAHDDLGIIRAISESALEFFPALKNFSNQSTFKLSDFIDIDVDINFSSKIKKPEGRKLVTVIMKMGHEKRHCHGVIYRSNGLLVLEVEPGALVAENVSGLTYLSHLPSMMNDIQRIPEIHELLNFSASKIKELTDFDRVMIYQYDADWNGEVVAEAKEDDLESFLGLHYPASDIPVQARALYEKNWTRIIPTIYYTPSQILPKSQQYLDLSDSLIRSVSPMHIQYLKNMGVGASMSVSLMVDGKLWGLIACHHYRNEHYIPVHVRMGCESYGQLMSWHIKTLESARSLMATQKAESQLHHVLKSLSDAPDFLKVVEASQESLLELFNCSGIVIRLGELVAKVGIDPGDDFCEAISKALTNRTILDPVVTNEAKSILHEIKSRESSAGFMALTLAPKHNYYIICVRPPEKQTVNWAGNPHSKTTVDFNNPSERLLPRGSFALWQEFHEWKSAPWSPIVVDLLKRFALLFVKIVIERREISEKSNQELRELNRAKDEFVATVSHELRTPLNSIIGWTELALSRDLSAERIPEALRIIQRNARSQNQLINDLLDVSRILAGKMRLSTQNMRLSEVVDAVILSFRPSLDAKSIKLIAHTNEDSDSIIGDPSRIQQVIWNILGNAVKFSAKNSRIWIRIYRVRSHVDVEVRDEGEGLAEENLLKIFGRFEQVETSASKKAPGLGLGLAIAKHIVELHGGDISAKSEGPGKGSTFTASFPISPLRPYFNEDLQLPNKTDEQVYVSQQGKMLEGQVILIVEDETDALGFLNVLITAHGAKTYTASNGVEAMEILEAHKSEIGVLLSDIGMPLMDGLNLIAKIRASSDKEISTICAVALTAFGRPQDRIISLRAGFDSYIAKPVIQEELLTVLETTCRFKRR
jgi:chemotaxis family two-component system sensor kinase Cph1